MRKFISTNLSPSMIIALSMGGCTLENRPVNIGDLRGERFYDSLNNNGVRGYLKKNGLEIVKVEDNDKPLHFQLTDGDELYLVADMPGARKKIPDYKDQDDLEDLVKPVIIKMVARAYTSQA